LPKLGAAKKSLSNNFQKVTPRISKTLGPVGSRSRLRLHSGRGRLHPRHACRQPQLPSAKHAMIGHRQAAASQTGHDNQGQSAVGTQGQGQPRGGQQLAMAA